MRTISEYGRSRDERLLRKCAVVYPAIREVNSESDKRRSQREGISLLFNGDFFRKGGANVVDAFERIQKIVPKVRLNLCCDEVKDFNTGDLVLREKYLTKIKANSAITLGRVSRAEMIESIMPQTDIYLLPTYAEAFGFAILETMAFGIPVVSTNYFAIPEMVSDQVTGLLIDTSRFNCDKMFPGYFVNQIPKEFHSYVSSQVFEKTMRLIDSPRTRNDMGIAARSVARSKFGFDNRNRAMREIYEQAVSG